MGHGRYFSIRFRLKILAVGAEERVMKLPFSFVGLVLSLTLSALPAFADPSAPVVQDEYAKEKARFDTVMIAARKKLSELQKAQEKAIEASKAQAKVDLEGVAVMKKYWTLINYRYGNEEGKFQNWKVVDTKDVENINNLFGTYLRSKPLTGRISAGTADRTLDWGMTRLEEMAKMHGSPRPDNNSDVEILSYQIKDTESKMKIITDQADRLGVKITEQQPVEDAPAVEAPARSQASQ